MKVITITLSTSLNTPLNLINIAQFIDIDCDIIGIKYNFGNHDFSKGIYKTFLLKRNKYKEREINKQSFYNQLSMIVFVNNHDINVKIFQNGSLHLTGCKFIEEGKQICDLLMLKFNKINILNYKKILIPDVNGIFSDSLNFLYKSGNIIGYCKMNVYYLYEQVFYPVKNKENIVLISKKEILDKCFNKIGYISKKQKYKNKYFNYFYNKDNIDNSEYNYEIEIINYNIRIINSEKELKNEYNIEICSINVCFDLNYNINRQQLYNYLSNTNICIYDPNRYAGLKVIYKIQNESVISCTCNVKCVCSSTTLLIFQSGKIIITGSRTMVTVKNVHDYFLKQIEKIK